MQYLLLCFEPVIYNKREWASFFSLVYNQWFIHAVNCRAGVIFLVYSSNGYELSPYYWSCGWELRRGLLSWKEAKESQEALRTKCIHNSLVTLSRKRLKAVNRLFYKRKTFKLCIQVIESQELARAIACTNHAWPRPLVPLMFSLFSSKCTFFSVVILKVFWTLALNIVIRNFRKFAIWTHCICVSINCVPGELARFCHWLPLGDQRQLLYSWKFLPNSAHWLLRGHMTSNNKSVARQNLWAGSIAKSMASEGNGTLLQRGVMNFQL